MNERGNPETLVASHPGNLNAVRHVCIRLA
jgi:hypothetical protein